jgi:hypothetical protein
VIFERKYYKSQRASNVFYVILERRNEMQQRITNYACWWCGDMVTIKEYPEVDIIEGKENVFVYDCPTQTGLKQPTPICIRCKDLVRQIINEEISSNKKTKE